MKPKILDLSFDFEVKRYNSWLKDSDTSKWKKFIIYFARVLDTIIPNNLSTELVRKLSPLYERNDLTKEQQEMIIFAQELNYLKNEGILERKLHEILYDTNRTLYYSYKK